MTSLSVEILVMTNCRGHESSQQNNGRQACFSYLSGKIGYSRIALWSLPYEVLCLALYKGPGIVSNIVRGGQIQ